MQMPALCSFNAYSWRGKKTMMKAVAMAYVPWNMHLVQPQVYVCVCVWTYVQMCWREHASAIWISCLDRLWQLTQVEKEKGKHANWHACKHTHTLHTHNSWMTMLSPWRRTLDPSGRMCCVTGCVYPPYPSNAEVLRAEYCWPMLNSQRRMRRMRCEPRQAQAHLKCQILGIRDRSVKTLSWLWLTLPCGRDWRGLSQEIGIHKGSCARQCWTGHLKHRTALIQLLSRWFLRHFLRSDSLLYSPTAVRLESGCFKQTLWLDSNQTTRNCDHQASRPFLYPIFKCSITKSHIFVCKRTLSSCIHKQNVYLLWFYFDKKCLVWLSWTSGLLENTLIVYLSGTLMS